MAEFAETTAAAALDGELVETAAAPPRRAARRARAGRGEPLRCHRRADRRPRRATDDAQAVRRRAFGFHSAGALIALAMLTLGGLCPPLPGR